jgi:enoyl-CoA hydratase
LAADIRLVGDHAELALPEVRLGAVPGWTGSQRLPALIGAGRAKQMVFSGARIDASTAEQWGLVNEVIPGEGLMARSRELALEISRNAPLAVQMAKQLVNGALGFETGSALEALAGGLAASTQDAREGVAAFIERREPNYSGR